MSTGLVYRSDIDGLRAVAVLAVIASHLPEKYLPSGWLGVDVFFVISGFVVTASVLARQEPGLGAFYTSFLSRRVKRLWGALVTCVAVTGAVVWLVDPLPWQSLKTGIASLFGVSNIALLVFEMDYFAPSTQFNAFTHTWSLGVEEQFYVVFPFIVWFAAFRREHQPHALAITVVLLSAASLASFYRLYELETMTAYYLMPTRFWELGAGVLTYLLYRGSWGQRLAGPARVLSPVALACLLLVFFAPPSQAVHATVAAVACTAVILFAPAGFRGISPLTLSPVVYIGKISYSLYLWHWPVVALGPQVLDTPWRHNLLYLGCMFGAAVISYHCVENPLRRKRWSRSRLRDIALGVTASLVVGLGLFAGMKISNDSLMKLGPPKRKLIHSGLSYSDTCVVSNISPMRDTTFEDCTTPPRPAGNSMLWVQGDSHAGHLQGMLYGQYDRHGLGVHLVELPGVPFPFSGDNIAEERTILDNQIRQHMRAGDIMVVSRRYLNRSYPLAPLQDVEGWVESTADLGRELAARGVALVVVGPPPRFSFTDVRECLGREDRARCEAPRAELAAAIDPVMAALRELATTGANIHVFDIFAHLCPPANTTCYAYRGKHFLYRDKEHLNLRGSKLLAQPFSDFLQAEGLYPAGVGPTDTP